MNTKAYKVNNSGYNSSNSWSNRYDTKILQNKRIRERLKKINEEIKND